MIDDVTGARARSPTSRRAGITPLERSPRRRVPLDPAVNVTLAGRALRRSGPSVAPAYAGPTRVAGGTVAGFGACLASSGAGFAPGNAAARTATPAGGGAECDGGENQGDEKSAHTQGLSAE